MNHRDTTILSQQPRVVYLVNFLAPDIYAICRHWRSLVDRLDILVSVAMEGNRQWQPQHEDLSVIVQKTWTVSRTDRHPGGYEDVNYVHIPLDTYHQLRRLRPDVIVSAELGIRSIVASLYRLTTRKSRLVIAVSTSEHIEQSRGGFFRRLLRRWLLNQADAVTHNGDSCRRFLLSLGVPEEKLSPWNYAADPTKPYRGELHPIVGDNRTIRLLTVGQLIQRKGVEVAAQQLSRWATLNPQYQLVWVLVGSGPSETAVRAVARPSNFEIVFKGNCDSDQIRAAYADSECMLFPTLGDEWGLVVDEAMLSGLAVIGSDKAQSCPTLIRDGVNGYLFDPADANSLASKLDCWASHSTEDRMRMRVNSRAGAADRTPELAASQIDQVSRQLFSGLSKKSERVV